MPSIFSVVFHVGIGNLTDKISTTLSHAESAVGNEDICLRLQRLDIVARAYNGDAATADGQERITFQCCHVISCKCNVDGAAIDDELSVEFITQKLRLGLDAVASNVAHDNRATVHLEILLSMDAVALGTCNCDDARRLLHLDVFFRADGMLHIASHRERATTADFQMTFAEERRLACCAVGKGIDSAVGELQADTLAILDIDTAATLIGKREAVQYESGLETAVINKRSVSTASTEHCDIFLSSIGIGDGHISTIDRNGDIWHPCLGQLIGGSFISIFNNERVDIIFN